MDAAAALGAATWSPIGQETPVEWFGQYPPGLPCGSDPRLHASADAGLLFGAIPLDAEPLKPRSQRPPILRKEPEPGARRPAPIDAEVER
ncbi:MAG TPA: hypothetical protein VHT27_01200 [Solirubrobacteraceae bacterium]|nr:hypothetical protein [Solirubrobacteraceae bacterium]